MSAPWLAKTLRRVGFWLVRRSYRFDVPWADEPTLAWIYGPTEPEGGAGKGSDDERTMK